MESLQKNIGKIKKNNINFSFDMLNFLPNLYTITNPNMNINISEINNAIYDNIYGTSDDNIISRLVKISALTNTVIIETDEINVDQSTKDGITLVPKNTLLLMYDKIQKTMTDTFIRKPKRFHIITSENPWIATIDQSNLEAVEWITKYLKDTSVSIVIENIKDALNFAIENIKTWMPRYYPTIFKSPQSIITKILKYDVDGKFGEFINMNTNKEIKRLHWIVPEYDESAKTVINFTNIDFNISTIFDRTVKQWEMLSKSTINEENEKLLNNIKTFVDCEHYKFLERKKSNINYILQEFTEYGSQSDQGRGKDIELPHVMIKCKYCKNEILCPHEVKVLPSMISSNQYYDACNICGAILGYSDEALDSATEFGKSSAIVSVSKKLLSNDENQVNSIIKILTSSAKIFGNTGYFRSYGGSFPRLVLGILDDFLQSKKDSIVTGMEKIIKELSAAKLPFTCPHGRPTMIKVSVEELEKKFRRKG